MPRYLFAVIFVGLFGLTGAAEETATPSSFDLAQAAEEDGQFANARHNYLLACRENVAEACTALGRLHYRGDGGQLDLRAAERLYKEGCGKGDARGCALLGYHYNRGFNGAPDYVASRQYYRASCDLELVDGCAALGNQLYAGVGGPHRRAEGKKLMQDACDAEFEWACERLVDLGFSNRRAFRR